MKEYFSILLSTEVEEFLDSIDEKARNKILYNIDKAKITLDPKIFKKLTQEIWEFRTKYGLLQYRLFAFWDKRDNKKTLVIATHGIVKKTQKTPKEEIEKAMRIREYYFSKTK
jgi:phage-related protein